MSVTSGSLDKPEGASTIAPTSTTDLDAALDVLARKSQEWVTLPIPTRIELLDAVIENTRRVADRWVEAACLHKGISKDAPVAGEEWHSGPVLTIRNARLLRNSLEDIAQFGTPRIPGPVTVRPDGQTVAQVFPVDTYDKVLWAGYTGEVWMQPGVTPGNLPSTMARAYREGRPGVAANQAGVALVLGAGNIASIPPMDVLTKLFVDNEVTILKMNPVNEYLGPFLAESFAPFIEKGYLRIVYGGANGGSYLSHHDKVTSVHITGSDKTHDSIVFGPGPEGARRKAESDPLLDKEITSELGNVSPVIVVPGPWTAKDLEYQGKNIAAMLTHNAGFNCVATRVVVTHKDWLHREALLESVSKALHATPRRKAYYPGAEDRWRTFAESHHLVKEHGEPTEGAIPWTLIHDLDSSDPNHTCFAVEAFAGVFGEAPLDAPRSVPDFLSQAVSFANDSLWGTLGASLIVHPATMKDPETAAAVEKAIADLRYGTVGLNVWTGLGYAFTSTTWGGFPGHDLTDIQSGRGTVHNSLMFDMAQKSVVRGPFRQQPKPLWFTDNRQAHNVTRHLVALEADPSALTLAPVLAAAVRG